MAVTYDPTTDRGRVRFLMADTHAATAVYSDAEIDDALSQGGSVDEAVNYLLRQAMAVAGLRGDANRVSALERLLKTRGGTMPTVSVVFPASLPMDDAYDENNP